MRNVADCDRLGSGVQYQPLDWELLQAAQGVP